MVDLSAKGETADFKMIFLLRCPFLIADCFFLRISVLMALPK
jgi:hypothetical protein